MARTVSLRHADAKTLLITVDGERHKFTEAQIGEAVLAAMFNAWYRGASLTIAPSVLRLMNSQFGEWTEVMKDGSTWQHIGFPARKL